MIWWLATRVYNKTLMIVGYGEKLNYYTSDNLGQSSDESWFQ